MQREKPHVRVMMIVVVISHAHTTGLLWVELTMHRVER